MLVKCSISVYGPLGNLLGPFRAPVRFGILWSGDLERALNFVKTFCAMKCEGRRQEATDSSQDASQKGPSKTSNIPSAALGFKIQAAIPQVCKELQMHY